MRAGIYNGIKSVSLGEAAKPEMKPGCVLVKNITAGICGTDLHAYNIEGEGVGIMPGNVFGHEMYGEIVEVAEDVEGFEIGKRVFVNPMCFRNVPEGWTNTMSADMAGAFGEYVLVERPMWDVTLFEIPETVSPIKAALVEPLSVSMNGVLLAGAKKGDKAIVYGAGPIGLGALASLKFMGVEEVIVADTVPLRLETVKKMGGIPCDVTKTPVNEFAKELWGKSMGYLGQETTLADIVIDCAGYPKAITDYLECAGINSKLVCVALGPAREEISTYEVVMKGVQIIGSCGYTPETNKKVIEMLQSDIDVESMVTAVYGLSEFEKAFEEAAKSNENIKVVLEHAK